MSPINPVTDADAPLNPYELLDAIPDCLTLISADGTICYLNAAWQRLLGSETMASSGLTVGGNYLGSYQSAMSLGATACLRLTEHIQRVLDGIDAQTFLDLPYTLAGTNGWLSLNIVPYMLETERGALIQQRILARPEATKRSLDRDQDLLHALMESMPEQIYFKDTEGRFLRINQVQANALGVSHPDDAIGTRDNDYYVNEICEEARQDELRIIATGQPLIDKTEGQTLYNDETKTSSERWVSTTKAPIFDRDGTVIGIVGITRNITVRKQAEDVLRQSIVQEQTIRAQAATLKELSTPVIPINDDVLIMPLIGELDSQRVEQMQSVLLDSLQAQHAAVVILDLTGVPQVDTQVASALIQAAQAVRLLGAEAVLTGIRPELAQTIIGLGIDLRAFATQSNLQQGIAYATSRTRRAAQWR